MAITIEDLVGLNCRDNEENKLKLQKALTKTKWLERYEPEEITLDILDKLYWKVIEKYPVRIGYMMQAGDNSMTAMLRHENNKWVDTIYFVSFWECMAKVILVLYGYNVKGLKFKEDKN